MPSFAYFPFAAFPLSSLAASLCPRSFRLFSPFRASGSWPGPEMLCIARKDKIFDVHLDARQIHFCIVRCPLLSLSLCEGGKKISWNAVKNYLTYSCLCSFFFRTWPLRDEIMSSLANDIFLMEISVYFVIFSFSLRSRQEEKWEETEKLDLWRGLFGMKGTLKYSQNLCWIFVTLNTPTQTHNLRLSRLITVQLLIHGLISL